MINDASGFSHYYVCGGYVDLRKGIDGLSDLIRYRYGMDPMEDNALFLFCGRRADRLKGLTWEGD